MQTIVDRYKWFIQQLATTQTVRPVGPTKAMTTCPAHDDRQPSLSIKAGHTAIALHCFGGCHPADVMAALGMVYGDLWPDDGIKRLGTPSAWKAYQVAIKHDNERHRPDTVKVAKSSNVQRRKETTYTYRDEFGETVGMKIRYQLVDPDTGEIVGKTFTQHAVIDGDQQRDLAGVTLPIYNLPDVLSGIQRGIPIWLVEGEKDADTLTRHGCIATTFAGGADGKLLPEIYGALTGADIQVIIDQDAAGRAYAQRLHAALNPIAHRIRYFTAAIGKDATDHIQAGRDLDEFIPYPIDRNIPADPDPQQLDDDTTPVIEPSSWLPKPILEMAAAAETEPAPTILKRTDDIALFYRGRVNGILGEAESGKTWIAIKAVAETLAETRANGGTVVYLDFEDTAAGTLGRLHKLIAKRDDPGLKETDLERLHYISPDENLGEIARVAMLAEIHQLNPHLIIVDGYNAGMTILGLDINSNNDATLFATRILRPLADTGAAVTYIDHVPKNKETRGKGGIGAQAKRAMTTGACITVKVIAHPAPGTIGTLRISVDKDRPGRVREHARGPKAHWGTVTIDGTVENQVAITIKPPSADDQDDDEPQHPNHLTFDQLAERISIALGTSETPLSVNRLETICGGRKGRVADVLTQLVEREYVRRYVKPYGAGERYEYTLIKPYEPLNRQIPGND